MCLGLYLCLLHAIDCHTRHIFHRRVWYHALSLRYACIRRPGIILITRLPLCQISLFSQPPLLSQLMENNHVLTYSVTQLICCPGNGSFRCGTRTQ